MNRDARRLAQAARGVAVSLFVIGNTVFWAVPVYAATLLRLIAPARALRGACDRGLTRFAELWITINTLAIDLALPTHWTVTGVDSLDPDCSYLVNANHQSWTDIVVLQKVFNRRIPFLRFFLKRELIWVPILGLAWWALHFPFMKRYSRETIERNPGLRGKDLETTRKVCDRLRGTPVSIINFLEGTRFTPSKHERQRSPYRHLLRPKAGGFAFVLGAIGDQLRSMIDVTIVYPEQRPSFWDFLCGRVPSVLVHVEERPLPAELLRGDYTDDPLFRDRFQAWVRDLWGEKDALIDQLLASRPGSVRNAA